MAGCRCDLCREAENGYRRAWLAANPDKHARYHREYLARLDNRLRNAEQCRSWHVANRERVIERQRRYFADHPEVHRANRSNRRARIRGNGGTHTAADIAAQRKRQKGVCFWRATEECQARGGKLGRRWHVDHVVPLALGGSNGPENLVIACPTCNCSKGHSHPMDWAGRML